MPLGQSQDIPQADPGGRVTPRFWHRLIRFRHFLDGLLALASLNLACRNLVPAFPQRSPPSLLTTAACGGLRSTPDCRPRRAVLHLSYSYAAPCGPALLVTQDHPAKPELATPPSLCMGGGGEMGWRNAPPGADGRQAALVVILFCLPIEAEESNLTVEKLRRLCEG